MNRRKFLAQLAVSPAIVANILGGTSMISMMKNAYAANGKKLIIIFQRGGCDGMNTIVPYAEDDYYSLRPDIAISPPGFGARSVVDLDGFFGLHPSLAPLLEIYQQGDMAILPAVHYPNANRSHFRSQDLIESASDGTNFEDGWLNRHISTLDQNTPFRAVSIGGNHYSLRGNNNVSTISDLSILESENIDNLFFERLDSIFQESNKKHTNIQKSLKNQGSIMLDNLEIFSALKYSNYSEENGANYPDSLLGQHLRQTAHLLKSEVGLEVITVDSNGWDDHANQGGTEGPQAERHLDFSSALAALYKDLGSARMKETVILTMTEFGRTAKQNASRGTDHGNASSWFVIGGEVNGGIYGEWPGLKTEDLYLERYLKHTIDFRNIFSEIMSNHFGNIKNIPYIIPNHTYKPIGFLNA